MRSRTAPWPRITGRDQASAHWISFYVGENCPQVAEFDGTREESVLPNVTRFTPANIEPTGIVVMHTTENLRQSGWRGGDRDHMNVVGHQAIAEYLHSVHRRVF